MNTKAHRAQMLMEQHYRARLQQAIDKAKDEPLQPLAMLEDIGQSWARATPGTWGQGVSSHETVSSCLDGVKYHVAHWRHASDAHFADISHALVPHLLAYIADLQDQINNLKSSKEGT